MQTPGWWTEHAHDRTPADLKLPAAMPTLNGTARRLLATTKVVLGGGALYGTMYIGALMALVRYDKRAWAAWAAGVTHVAGTSAGALVGFMLAAGADPWTMRRLVHNCGIHRVARSLLDVDPGDLIATGALSSGKATDEACQGIVAALTGSPTTTFLDLYGRTRRTFVAVVTNAYTAQAEFWSHDTMPDLEVWRALRASTAIPILFPPVDIDGGLYYDGGLACNLPCHLFPPEDTLTLLVRVPPGKQPPTTAEGGAQPEPRQPPPFRTLFSSMFVALLDAAQIGILRERGGKYVARAVPVYPCAPVPLGAYKFDVTPAQLDAFIAEGAGCLWGTLLRETFLCVVVAEVLWLARRTLPRPVSRVSPSGP